MVENPHLSEALLRFVQHKKILITLDFDGTLAPLVDDPAESRMLPQAHKALVALGAMRGVTVALVSGRAIDSLRAVAEPAPEWFLVGSHGGEIVAPGEREDYEVPSVVPPGMERAFRDVVAAYPGTRLETKAFGLALHTRGVEESAARNAETAARQVAQDHGGSLTIREGHGILEFSVLEATKGDAIRELREQTHADGVFFAGDDKTDEDAIVALVPGDIGIWVGPGHSRAEYRLSDAANVAGVLSALARLRGL